MKEFLVRLERQKTEEVTVLVRADCDDAALKAVGRDIPADAWTDPGFAHEPGCEDYLEAHVEDMDEVDNRYVPDDDVIDLRGL